MFPAHFTDVRELARGGMGVLFSAHDTRTGKRVALKTLPPGRADEAMRARFLREARALERLSHPFVVSIVELDAATPFFAMELVEGDDLAARLARGERPGVRAAVRLAIDVADALSHVHRAGVLHRDLKPANVIPLASGVKVLDFGLARVEGEDTRLTRSGQALGTPAYMAPEQLDGRPPDARTDVYALGSLLYELLAGETPFGVDRYFLKAMQAPRPPSAANPGVTPALDRAVLGALAPLPAGRPASMAAFKAELSAALRELDELEGFGSPDPLDEPLSRDLPPVGGRPALEPGQVREVVGLRARLVHEPGLPRERVVCRLAAEVDRHGGRVERYEPGGLVAFFGLDVPGEADAERAVAAGIEIATHAARIGRELGAKTQAHVVVDAARLSVRPDRAIDEEPLTALRTPLADLGPGVWVSSALAPRVERRFLLGAPEGAAELAQVTGVDALAAEEDRRAARASGPLLGRQRELAMLRAAWDAIVLGSTRDRPGVVVVSGPPGIGKSRLVEELLARLPDDGHPHLRATAAGLTDQPYRLAAVIVRRALGLSTGDTEARRQRLAERIERLRPGRAGPALVDALADLLGLPGDQRSNADARVDAIHRAVAGLLELLGRRTLARLRRPQLLVVEDLEEADALSRAALDTALDRAGRGLFAVVTCRPPFAVPARWRRAAEVTELALTPLANRDARRLLRAVRGEGADDAEDELVERAGGNPLFLEELAAHGPGALPPALEALVLARFARVAPVEREVAEAAAVLGATVEPLLLEELLRALRGAPPADLEPQLTRLVDAGLLRSLSPGELAFQPELARAVLERAMPPANRRLMHRLAVRVLDEVGGHDDALLERVAHHADASGDRLLALERLGQALDRATARPDPPAMRRLADRTLALLATGDPDPRAVFGALSAREHALELSGEGEAQRADLTRMMALARELDAPDLRTIALDRLSRFTWSHRGDHRTAADLARQALDLATRLPDKAAQASALRNLGCALSVAGDFAGALTHHRKALSLYKALEDMTGVARTLCSLAINSGELGRLTEAHALVKKALEIEEARGARRGVGMALRVLADLHRSIGDHDRALSAYQKALATDIEIGYRHGEAHGLAGAAAALLDAGRLDEARARATDALAVALPLEARAVAIEALVVLAQVELSRGQDARDATARAVELAHELDTPRWVALAESWRARALAASGDAEAALKLSRASVKRLPETLAAEPKAREMLWNHAVVAKAAGNAKAASEALAAARALVEERAGRLPEGAVRRSFLAKVSVNRRILDG